MGRRIPQAAQSMPPRALAVHPDAIAPDATSAQRPTEPVAPFSLARPSPHALCSLHVRLRALA